MFVRTPLLRLAPLALTACLGTTPSEGGHAIGEMEAERAETPENAIVVDAEALSESDDWLLYALASHIPSISVNFNPMNSRERCPRISLRGPLVGTSLSNPLVYVNGTRTSNTCVLVNIRSTETAWVEVYPTGSTRRPGYTTHPHGLILVFTRRI